jgi:hypothetical protein
VTKVKPDIFRASTCIQLIVNPQVAESIKHIQMRFWDPDPWYIFAECFSQLIGIMKAPVKASEGLKEVSQHNA